MDEIRIETLKTAIGLLLRSGDIEEKDLIPIIQKGTAKWMDEKEEDVFVPSNKEQS